MYKHSFKGQYFTNLIKRYCNNLEKRWQGFITTFLLFYNCTILGWILSLVTIPCTFCIDSLSILLPPQLSIQNTQVKYIRRIQTFHLTINLITLPMLRLLSSEAQGRKDFEKPSKPCHVGIHRIALAELSQMSTHLPGFQSFSRVFA